MSKTVLLLSLFIFSSVVMASSDRDEFLRYCSANNPDKAEGHCACFYDSAVSLLTDSELEYFVGSFTNNKDLKMSAQKLPGFDMKQFYSKKMPVVRATADCMNASRSSLSEKVKQMVVHKSVDMDAPAVEQIEKIVIGQKGDEELGKVLIDAVKMLEEHLGETISVKNAGIYFGQSNLNISKEKFYSFFQ